MPRHSTNLLAAAISTALCSTAFLGFGFYAAVDENIGAGFLSFVFMMFTVCSAIWCIAAFITQRRGRRVEARGFPVLTADRDESTTAPAGRR